MRAPLALVLILLPATLAAQEIDYSSSQFWAATREPERRTYHRHRPKPQHQNHHRHAHKPAPAPPPAPIVPSYHAAYCLGEVRAHGTPHLTEAAAMDAAKRHWQAVVRYDFGEKFMNIETAASIKYRCARAETNETAAGRLAEAVSGEAWRMRCEVVAHPCRSELKEAP